jgi:hypothetical protein
MERADAQKRSVKAPRAMDHTDDFDGYRRGAPRRCLARSDTIASRQASASIYSDLKSSDYKPCESNERVSASAARPAWMP